MYYLSYIDFQKRTNLINGNKKRTSYAQVVRRCFVIILKTLNRSLPLKSIGWLNNHKRE